MDRELRLTLTLTDRRTHQCAQRACLNEEFYDRDRAGTGYVAQSSS